MTCHLSFMLSFCVLLLGACAPFHSAKTPQGVDVTPIIVVPLSGSLDQIESLKSILPNGAKYPKNGKTERITYNFSSADPKDKNNVFRSFDFYRFDDVGRALDKYETHKRMFTDRSEDWKLFKEDRGDGYRYFSSYKTPWMDTNHGIPIGVVTSPEILVCIQKQNLLIVVSFHSYRDDVDYVGTINKDIAYVGTLLNKLASDSHQNAPRDAPKMSRP